ncbi:hypothetical protein SCD_n02580 [Sulfuricella denitrificans skB26]|uniref:DUF599 domain-containing protein n=1 Tax=Sulfuricella denitrificans (strain DSM 22764 / NBRC 105220 / skB26) TaxID=1163617 RepID=S6B7G3_SULDS|nr:DUF599 domain-containing protein [Sulfuricella denitrificans]BAN36382.1 hypothetical protein SCD_n02580 [Sulfuricella denitrificans skB26]
MDSIASYAADLISFLISVSLVIAYQLYLKYKEAKNPAYTVAAVNVMARSAWVETIMREGKDILAVQTLRNSTMAATFLASTAILLIIGVLTLSGQEARLGSTWHSLNAIGAKHSGLWLAKLLLLLLDLFIAFFSFSMSVRVFNHVGYMINVPVALNHKAISPAHVATHLNRAGMFYHFGMRAYYYIVPIVFWLFGPHFMLIATLGLLIVLYRIDRAPKIMVDDYGPEKNDSEVERKP